MSEQSSINTLKIICVDLWEEFGKTALIIIGVILALVFSGGMYRVSKGEPFWGKSESSSERTDRLIHCAKVADDNLSPQQQMDSGDAGVCSGFTKLEIEQAQADLGL